MTILSPFNRLYSRHVRERLNPLLENNLDGGLPLIYYPMVKALRESKESSVMIRNLPRISICETLFIWVMSRIMLAI